MLKILLLYLKVIIVGIVIRKYFIMNLIKLKNNIKIRIGKVN